MKNTYLILRAQLNIENYFEELAKLQKKDVLIVCDRGACDTFAYCSKEVQEAVLKKENWSIDFLNHHRYDKIIHMVTAANGAESYYGLDNDARSENLTEGINLDRNIQKVWFTNPRYVIVDNSEQGFQKKISRVFTEIGELLSMPTEKFVRKFLLKNLFKESVFPEGITFAPYVETINYLSQNDKNVISYLRKREYVKSAKMILTLKTRHINEEIEKRIETGRPLDQKVYNEFLNQKDLSKQELKKECFYFRMEDNTNVSIYKIETFMLKENPFSILHLTSNSVKKNKKFPEFLEVVEEVTNNKSFFTHKLAKI
jgi:hypothetical protein